MNFKVLSTRVMGPQEVAKIGGAGISLRFPLVLAEEGGALVDFERQANFGPFIIIPGGGQAHMQPILREDAARCVVETIGRPELLGKIFELGGPEVVTVAADVALVPQAPLLTQREPDLTGA